MVIGRLETRDSTIAQRLTEAKTFIEQSFPNVQISSFRQEGDTFVSELTVPIEGYSSESIVVVSINEIPASLYDYDLEKKFS